MGEFLFGSGPIIESDRMPHRRRCMQGHAAANEVSVIAANRIREETNAVEEPRFSWRLFRDRRPEMYGKITD